MAEIKKDPRESLLDQVRSASQPKKDRLLTLAAARALLKTPKPLSPGAAAIFGPTINRLPRILQDPEFCELEAQLLSGSITAEEFIEWSTVLPDCKRITRQLDDLASRIYQYIEPQIPNLIAGALSVPREVHPLAINNLFTEIVELGNSQRHVSAGLTTKGYQIDRFTDSLLERVSLGLYKAAFNQFGEQAAFRFADYLAGNKRVNKRTGESEPFSGFNAVKYRYQSKQAIKGNPATAKEIFEDLNEGSANFATPENFAKIDDLATIKKAIDITVETPKGRVMIQSSTKHASVRVAFITICLDKNTIKVVDGREKFLLDTTMSFALDRATGEILLNGTEQTADIVLGKNHYIALKNLVYKKLLQELDAAEYNDEETEPTAEPTAEEVITEVQVQIEEAAPALVKPKRKKRSKDEIRAENFHFGLLRGIKGNRLLGILENLCKSEAQDGTSHRMFFSKISGTKISVPIHGDDQVGTGLMIKCLKDLELTPQDVYYAM